MSADFSKLLKHLADNLRAHAELDYPGTTGPNRIRQAIFLSRGGHAPGEHCPNPPKPTGDGHEYWCPWPGDECECNGVQT